MQIGRWSDWSYVYTHEYTHIHGYMHIHGRPCSCCETQSTIEEVESNYSQLNSKRLLSLFDILIRAFHLTRAWNGMRTEERKIDMWHGSVCVCVCWSNILLCLTPETDYVGGLPSIERDKTDLDVAGMLVASRESRNDPEIWRRILSVDAFEIAK